MSLNKVMLIGHLGADPESRSFQNGGKVVTFRLATSESWKDRNTGERKERTEWHTIVVNNEAIQKIVEQYARKGSRVYVEGQLRTRKWQDQAGTDRYSTEVVIQPFGGAIDLQDRKPSDPGRTDYSAHQDDGRWQGGGASSGSGGGALAAGGKPRPPADDLDDDVPF